MKRRNSIIIIISILCISITASCDKEQNDEVANGDPNAEKVDTPVFTPVTGEYHSILTITISTPTAGASIKYTTDGSIPSSANGTEYNNPVIVSDTMTIKAMAYKSGMTDSEIAEAIYTITPVTPPARATHDMVYGGGNKVVMFGGGGLGTSNSTYEYDTESHAWFVYDPGLKPSHRYGHAMVYIGDNKIIMFGGYDWSGYLNDIWEYNASDHMWENTSIDSDIMPPGRSEHSMTYTENNKILMFGGSYMDSVEHWLNDTWEFDITTSTWTQYNQNGTRPSPRKSHRMLYTGNNKLLLFGGHDSIGPTNVLWQYDIVDHIWKEITDAVANLPPPRFGHAMAKTEDNTIIIHGGNYGVYPNFSQRDDLWELNPISLTCMEYNTSGTKPTERADHRICYTGGDNLVFFGGANNYINGDYLNRYNDTWEYTVSMHTWTEY